jgi:protein KIBRA
MLETYMNEVQNYSVMNVETMDAQTNTECISEYHQRNLMLRLRERTSASTTSLRDPKIYPIEDRSSLVKRSQTFSPSAVTACNKSRYICRRSDSDSAMHFNITAAVTAQPQPHPFRRGAVERRSLRYHGKPPRLLPSELFFCF